MAIRDNGLFRKLERPAGDAAKGACYITGDAGPCVDTGVDIWTEGTLTLSLNAIRELAEVAGFSVNEEGEQLESDNAFLAHRIVELENQLEEANGQLEAIGITIARAAAAADAPPVKTRAKAKA